MFCFAHRHCLPLPHLLASSPSACFSSHPRLLLPPSLFAFPLIPVNLRTTKLTRPCRSIYHSDREDVRRGWIRARERVLAPRAPPAPATVYRSDLRSPFRDTHTLSHPVIVYTRVAHCTYHQTRRWMADGGASTLSDARLASRNAYLPARPPLPFPCACIIPTPLLLSVSTYLAIPST